MELVEKQLGSGVEWVVIGARGTQSNARSLDCAESFAIANDSASLGMTIDQHSLGMTMVGNGIFACVDPCEKWWLRLRGNPKRSGEVSQAAFLLKAETMGFDVALPWGDNQKFDFVVWRGNGRAMRVQVKGTGRLHRRGYEVQPVHATRRGGKKRYTKKDIDVIAAHVQPVDAWYLIPIERVGRAKSLRLYPGIERRLTSGKSGRKLGTRSLSKIRKGGTSAAELGTVAGSVGLARRIGISRAGCGTVGPHTSHDTDHFDNLRPLRQLPCSLRHPNTSSAELAVLSVLVHIGQIVQ